MFSIRILLAFMVIFVSNAAVAHAEKQPSVREVDSMRGVGNPFMVHNQSSFDCSAAAEYIPISECHALVAFYNATGGDTHWDSRNGWLKNPDPCWWGGITCTEITKGNILTLKVWNHNLTGTLPNDLFYSLPELVHLDLSGNDLSGPIPESISDLENLSELILSGNKFSGFIPDSLLGDTQSSIARLFLNDNNLSGMLPVDIGEPMVQVLDFSDNPNLGGPIPRSYMMLDNLAFLSVEQTQICMRPDEETQEWAESVFDLRPSGYVCQGDVLDRGIYLEPEGEGVYLCPAESAEVNECDRVSERLRLNEEENKAWLRMLKEQEEARARASLIAQCRREASEASIVALLQDISDYGDIDALDEYDEIVERWKNIEGELLILFIDVANGCENEEDGSQRITSVNNPFQEIAVMRGGGLIAYQDPERTLRVNTASAMITLSEPGAFHIVAAEESIFLINYGPPIAVVHTDPALGAITLQTDDYAVALEDELTLLGTLSLENIYLPIITALP